MTRLELSIAWRYLRSRGTSRLFSFISVIAMGGVLVGVSALIVINGVMTGMQGELREKILVGSPDIRVLSFGENLRIEHWQGALDTVRKQPGVVAAAPFVLTQGLATSGHDYVEGVYVAGIEPAERVLQPVTDIRSYAVQGDFRFASSDGKLHGVAIGRRLAERLNAYPGDTITLMSAGGLKFNAAIGGFTPKFARYEVTGVFRTGMYEYDNAYIYMAMDQAQDFAGLGSAVTGLEIRTADRWRAPGLAGRLADLLGYPYRVQDWQEQNAQLFQALKLEKLGMRVILLLIVLVAAFNIVSTLTMVVKDKTREIGILKAMGMRAAAVRRIFVIQGLVIGFVGTLIGAALGVAVGFAIDHWRLIALDPQVYFIDHLPVRLELLDISWIVLASVAIAVLATLYPSAQAARLYPVEAIRHE
jgi:lipoprotein-releasing system permease protein